MRLNENEHETYALIQSSPVLLAMAVDGMRQATNDPVCRETMRVYEAIQQYPEGLLWLIDHDARHRDDFRLPDGDLFDRKHARRVVRLFKDHLARRCVMLQSVLARLDRGEEL